jgi:hypothetical protein
MKIIVCMKFLHRSTVSANPGISNLAYNLEYLNLVFVDLSRPENQNCPPIAER